MEHLKTGDLVRLTGYSRASIARMARRFEIPGVCAPDGVHFAFEDGDELRQWIDQNKKRRGRLDVGRPRNRLASHASKATHGGGLFYNHTLRLAKLGDIETARKFIGLMERSMEDIRQVCDGESR